MPIFPNTPLQRHLKKHKACEEARKWAWNKTAKRAWEECAKPDWLIWWAGNTPKNDFKDVLRVVCRLAKKALKERPSEEASEAIRLAQKCLARPTDENRSDAEAVAWSLAAEWSLTWDRGRVYFAAGYTAFAAAKMDDQRDSTAYAASAVWAVADEIGYATTCDFIRKNLVRPY